MPFDNPSGLPPRPPEAEILQSALWLLRDRSLWCQRAFTRERHLREGGVIVQKCMVTAMHEAAYNLDLPLRESREALRRAFKAVVCEVEVPPRYRLVVKFLYYVRPEYRVNRYKIIWFNDHRSTRYETVVSALRRAIEWVESGQITWAIDSKP